MINAGLSVPQALVFALVVYSGTAQMVALPLIMANASIGIIAIAGFLAGVRFLIYSAAMAGNLRRLPILRSWRAAYLTVDAAAGVFLQRRDDRADRFTHRTTFLEAMNWTMWCFWMTGLVVGIIGAGWLPSSPKFSYLGVLAMFIMVIPMLKSRPFWLCAGAAAIVALLTFHWPYKLGLLAAIAAGISVGMWGQRASGAQSP
jgi:predicted branched-subunit amino acid permease